MSKGKVLAVHEPRTQRLTGRPADLEQRLRDMHAQGMLITDPAAIVPTWHGQEWATVAVQVRVPVKPKTIFERRPWILKLAGISAATAAAVGGLAWLLIYTVSSAARVAADIWRPVAGVAVGILILIAIVNSARRGHVCRGIHCPGCSGG